MPVMEPLKYQDSVGPDPPARQGTSLARTLRLGPPTRSHGGVTVADVQWWSQLVVPLSNSL
jgi:hypothetical protein